MPGLVEGLWVFVGLVQGPVAEVLVAAVLHTEVALAVRQPASAVALGMVVPPQYFVFAVVGLAPLVVFAHTTLVIMDLGSLPSEAKSPLLCRLRPVCWPAERWLQYSDHHCLTNLL